MILLFPDRDKWTFEDVEDQIQGFAVMLNAERVQLVQAHLQLMRQALWESLNTLPGVDAFDELLGTWYGRLFVRLTYRRILERSLYELFPRYARLLNEAHDLLLVEKVRAELYGTSPDSRLHTEYMQYRQALINWTKHMLLLHRRCSQACGPSRKMKKLLDNIARAVSANEVPTHVFHRHEDGRITRAADE